MRAQYSRIYFTFRFTIANPVKYNTYYTILLSISFSKHRIGNVNLVNNRGYIHPFLYIHCTKFITCSSSTFFFIYLYTPCATTIFYSEFILHIHLINMVCVEHVSFYEIDRIMYI